MSQRTRQPMSVGFLPAPPIISHKTHAWTTRGWRCIWGFVVNTSSISPRQLDPTSHQRTECLKKCGFTSSCHSKPIACFIAGNCTSEHCISFCQSSHSSRVEAVPPCVVSLPKNEECNVKCCVFNVCAVLSIASRLHEFMDIMILPGIYNACWM